MIDQNNLEQEQRRTVESMKTRDEDYESDGMSFIKAILVCLGGVIAIALLQ
jgi:hypothetical protein